MDIRKIKTILQLWKLLQPTPSCMQNVSIFLENHACKWMHLQELDLKNLLASCRWNDNAPKHKNVHDTIKNSKLQLEHVGSYYANHSMNLLEYYWVCGCKNNKRSHKVSHNHLEL